MKEILKRITFSILSLSAIIYVSYLSASSSFGSPKKRDITFLSASVEPYKIKVNETQTTRVSIESLKPIEKVTMKVPFEGGSDEVSLFLVEGDKNEGTWEGKWVAHNTLVKEYTTIITATDISGNSKETTASWWDDIETEWLSGWEQRERTVVTETSGSTLTDNKTEIDIAYQDGMQADFDDIRFTDADGITLLNYYLESKTDSSTAKFWVTIPSLPASADTSIYYYFGSPDVSSASDPNYAPEAGSSTVSWTETTTEDFEDGTLASVITSSGNVTLSPGADPIWSSKAAWNFINPSYPSPAAIDLDNDGDYDLMTGVKGGDMYAYKNINTISVPEWVYHSDLNGPNAITGYSTPTFADLDGDGDKDMIAGDWNGNLYAYKNTGSSSAPVWTAETGWNPPKFSTYTAPELGDLDGDGDYDLMVGETNGIVYAYKNTGSSSSPTWTAETGWNTVDIGSNAHPDLADLDGDGDLDLMVGENAGISYGYKNTGSSSSPTWTAETGWNTVDAGSYAAPDMVDFDNDGDKDIMIGSSGGIYAFRNNGTSSSPSWATGYYWLMPNVSSYSAPSFADLNNDGDYDLLLGANNGITYAFRNLGDASSPYWSYEYDWRVADIGSYSVPALGDLDNDGDYDLLIGESVGTIYAYKNTGSASSPTWTAETGWNLTGLGTDPAPVLADLDNDNDLDMLACLEDGICYGYKNTGSVSSPTWTAQTSWNTADIGYLSRGSLGDLDNDGDYDLLVGEGTGIPYAYKNTGSASSPTWTAQSSWNGADAGADAAPALADLDGDGDLDLLTGEYTGIAYAYENAPPYASSGNYISSTLDTGSAAKLSSLDFTATVPTNTTVKFQLAGNTDGSTWNFVGPDGTASTYYTADSTTFPAALQGKRFLRYKAYLETTDTAITSALNSITISYIPISLAWTETTTTDFNDGTLTDVIASNDEVGLGFTDLGWTSQIAWDILGIQYPKPTMADLDGDGDRDAMVGSTSGITYGLKNTGNTSAPIWTIESSWDTVDVGTYAAPALTDLDNDGDYDLMIGNTDGVSYAYKNTGSASSPTWTAQTSWNIPDVGDSANPTFADLDGDGDLDAMVGSVLGITYAYKNTGSASSPTWTAETGWNTADIGADSAPALADLDNDGDKDILIGEKLGITYGYKNTGSASSPTWTAETGWNTADAGDEAAPALADLDNDGDFDLLIGNKQCSSYAYKNTGSTSSPTWTAESSWNLVALQIQAAPALADLDNDGDLDLMVGTSEGAGHAFKNTGSASSPTWTAQTSWDLPDLGDDITPTFADLDNDGDYDLILGEKTGVSYGYKNTGSASSPTWTAQASWNVPDIGDFATPALADLDNDGDYDLLIGNTGGINYGYKNTGTASSPTWTAETGWNTADVGTYTRPAFADLDDDGDYDLLVGETAGISYAYKNTGSVSSPTWTAQTSWNVPDAGDDSCPIFGDLNNDGAYDLLVGNKAGRVNGFRNYIPYASSGNLVSSALDAGATAKAYSVSFNATLPTGTSVKFQLAANNDNTTWNFYGPDGTGSTYFDADSDAITTTSFTGNRYLKYKAYLETTDQTSTPSLLDISINYAKFWTETTTSDFSDGTLTQTLAGSDKLTLGGTISTDPVWTATSGWNTIDVGTYAVPRFADLDNDDDLDVMIGLTGGESVAYKNTGSVSSPAWTAQSSWDAPDPGARAVPAFADLDNDGDFDMLVGETTGNTNAYKNTGSASSPTWTEEAGWVVADLGASSAPALADLDNDGDKDLLIGLATGAVKGYRNTGSASSPTWTAYTSWDVTHGTYSIPDLADIDGDGDFDLLLGDADGITYAYKNTGSASSPTWTATTSWNAPDIGTYAAPALGDLDNDGYVDLLIGSNGGICYGYDNIPANNYYTSGNLVSSALDGTESINFGFINFNKTTPTNTTLQFQLAANTDNSTWNFTGPDDTGSTYYTTDSEAVSLSLDENHYLKYKAYLTTSNTAITPELLDFSILYIPTPTGGGGGSAPTISFTTQIESRPRPSGATGVSGGAMMQF